MLGAASDVLLRDGRIVSVTRRGRSEGLQADNVIDAGGRVLLPGLFDMHGHVVRWDGGLQPGRRASPPCATWATTTPRCSR